MTTTTHPCTVCDEPLVMTGDYDCAACGATPGERLQKVLDRLVSRADIDHHQCADGEYVVDRKGELVPVDRPVSAGDHLHFIDQGGVICDWCHRIQGDEVPI